MAKIAVGVVSMFCDALAERYGVPRADSLMHAGLREADLSDPEGHVTMSTFVTLLRFGQTHTNDPALGLRLARTWDLRQQGFWGYALLSSNSMRERIDSHLRYQPLRSPLDLSMSEADGVVTLDIVPRELPNDVLVTFIDWAVATSLLHMREQWGRKPHDLQVSLSYKEQPHHGALKALFDGELLFDAPCIRMRFSAHFLDRDLQGDPYLGKLARGQLDARLPTETAKLPGNIVDQVKERIAVLLDHDASLTRVSRELGLSARTLQRQLDSRQTSFHELVEEVRRVHALHAMRDTEMSVVQLAARLGYADAASFRRAFRRWTGQSPAGYRAAQRGAKVRPLTRDVRRAARKVSGG
ncbi:MAG TPA: AraC family transcriptional regulator ligand-binding domain-containing protein [Polyangiales bacterium]|nr:AraC family transcriptional regulator ligand-binding domain-containing protein [Polyangiales bacterium]